MQPARQFPLGTRLTVVGIVGGLGLVGCGGSATRVAGACASDSDCPADQSCVDQRCVGSVARLDGSAGDPGTPDIDVSPLAVDFATPLLGTPVHRAVIVENRGDAPLEVSRIAIVNDEGSEFSSAPGGDVELVIEPGQDHAIAIDVVYVRTRGAPAAARLTIASNDPDEGLVVVSLGGRVPGEANLVVCVPVDGSIPPSSCATPTALDFGTVVLGGAETREVVVWNNGAHNSLIELFAVTIEDDGPWAAGLSLDLVERSVSGDRPIDPPFDLLPGNDGAEPARAWALVSLDAARLGALEGTVRFWTDFQPTPQKDVPLTGSVVCPEGFLDMDDDPTDCETACPPPEPEVCDGQDNDCDGWVDEDLGETVCGIGECRRTVPRCDGGTPRICEPGEPGEERCDDDGLDNDCDGLTDEPEVEVCDGIDNDCDASTDEECDCIGSQTRPCGSEIGECVEGTQECVDGAWGPCEGMRPPDDEACNGLDDDCDGATDEDLGNTTCGLGECLTTVPNCEDGAPRICAPAPGTAEICDGLDNDCDGATDEDWDPALCSRIRVEAVIDGRSWLILKGNTARWHHLQYAAPGRLDFSDLPTVINGVTWWPRWPDIPNTENRDCQCDSDVFTGVSPALPSSQMTVVIQPVQARHIARLEQAPTQANAFELILDLDDTAPPGMDTYTVDVFFNAAPFGCNANGICEFREDCNSCGDCPGQSGGQPAGRYCCGNGVLEPAEGDGTICDGNP